MRNAELWTAIENHSFSEQDATLTFEMKLMREQEGWSSDFTRDAIAEYRRFIYLMAVSEQMLAPSRIVDKIWHHHLCYTENYWEVLCERIVGRPLHHNPFTGGDAMRQQLAEAYKRTLVIYREEFRQDPPSKFWPDPARPSRETRTSQYDPDRQVVLPRASILITAALGICFVIIALTQSQLTTLSGSFIAVAGAGLALRSLSLSGLIGGSERGTGVEVGFSCGSGCGGCGG